MTFRDQQRTYRLIREVENRIQPDAEWISRTRASLLEQVRVDLAREPGWQQTKIDYLRKRFISPRLMVLARGPVMAVLSVIGVVLGGSIASVSAAERSVPGDLLYPVKLAAEQTRLIFTKSKTEKLKLKTEFVERRVQEIKDIVSSDLPQKQDRLKEATEILKRDLDTVKTTLNEVSQEAPAGQVVLAAKMVDKKSTELASVLKTVKQDAPEEVRSNVVEAEFAALNTGVKAVQVLIDSHENQEVKDVVSSDELKQTIQGTVQNLEQGIASANQQLVNAGLVTSNATSTDDKHTPSLVSTSTLANPELTASTTQSLAQIQTVQESLVETKKLIEENKLQEVKSKLGEVTQGVANVEKHVDSLTGSATSSGTILAPSGGFAATSSKIDPIAAPNNAQTESSKPPTATSSTPP